MKRALLALLLITLPLAAQERVTVFLGELLTTLAPCGAIGDRNICSQFTERHRSSIADAVLTAHAEDDAAPVR